MPARNEPQPADEWTFVPQDDEVADEPLTPSAEAAAMHVEHAATPAEDAGRADVALGEATEAPEVTFEDEEPEHPSEQPEAADGEAEPDLEEILESQNYSFENEED